MKKRIYILIATAATFVLGAALIMLLLGPQTVMARLMGASVPPEGLDTATTRLSDHGLFQVTYTSSLAPIPINQIHTWTIHIETAEGQPVEQASITVDGGMPQHGHGLPTQPKVTRDLGNGDYTVEGMKFNMPGWWTVTFDITSGAQNDRVTYNLVLD
jgi:hypothetical protein